MNLLSFNLPFDLELSISVELESQLSFDLLPSFQLVCFIICLKAHYSNRVTCLCPQLEQQLAYSEFQRRVHNIVDKIDKYDIRDRDLLRQLRYLATVGPSVLPPDQLNRVCKIV